MAEKCFCHLNGYQVKDATARAKIAEHEVSITANRDNISENETLIHNLDNTVKGLSSTVTGVQTIATQNAGKITTLENNQSEDEGKISRLETEITGHGTRLTAVEGQTAGHGTRLTAVEGQTADHETRLTAVEASAGGGGGGLTWKKVTKSELQALINAENAGKLVKILSNKYYDSTYGPSTCCIPISRLYETEGREYGLYHHFCTISNVNGENPYTQFNHQIFEMNSGSASITGYWIYLYKNDFTFKYGENPYRTINDTYFDFYIEE